MWFDLGNAVCDKTSAGPEHGRGDEGCGARKGVDHDASRKVDHTKLGCTRDMVWIGASLISDECLGGLMGQGRCTANVLSIGNGCVVQSYLTQPPATPNPVAHGVVHQKTPSDDEAEKRLTVTHRAG